MKIENNLNANLPCPFDGLVEVFCGTLSVWRIGVVERPVSHGYSDDVETAVGDLLEIRELHPAVPVRLQHLIAGCIGAKVLSEGVFVDYAARAIEFLED